MANRIIAWRYTSNNGTPFSVGINSEIAAQLDANSDPKIGGEALAADHVLPPLPRQMKPRRRVFADATGYTREIIVMEPAAPLASLGAVTLNIEDSDGVTHACTGQLQKGESFRKRKQQAL